MKKWAEFMRVWREMRNEKLNDFFCTRNIIRVKAARRMRWAAQEARMGEKLNAYVVQDVICTDCTLINDSC